MDVIKFDTEKEYGALRRMNAVNKISLSKKQ